LKNTLLHFIVLISIAACSAKKSGRQGIIQLPSSQKIKTLDPVSASDSFSLDEVGKVYEGLMQYHYTDRPYRLIPNLAQDFPHISKDGLTYTFKIKPNVKFHDNTCFPNGKGRTLVASDFVFSLKRLADPKLSAAGWWTLDGRVKGLNEWRKKYEDKKKTNYDEEIEGLKAIDESTLQITLTKPYPQFLHILEMPFTYVVPKEAIDHYGETFLSNPVGTGPFKLKSANLIHKISYIKNKNYHVPGMPKANGIDVHVMEQLQTQWLSFVKGKLDLLEIPKDNFDEALTTSRELSPALKEKGIKLSITPSLDFTYIGFNLTHPILKKKKVRQAFALAQDNVEANNKFYAGISLPAQSPIPPGIAAYEENYKNPYMQHNLEKAKKLLSEAGYPNGKGLPEFTLDTVSSVIYRQNAEFFAFKLKNLGVKIKVLTNNWPGLTNKIVTGKTQMFTRSWLADYPDAQNFLHLFTTKNIPAPNYTRYSNPEYDKLYEQAATVQDQDKRVLIYKKLNRIITEDMPMIFGVHRSYNVLIQKRLKGYKRTEFKSGQAKYWSVD